MNPPVRDDEPPEAVQDIQSQDLAAGHSLHYENGDRSKHIIVEVPGGTSGRTSPPIISNLSINPLILVPPAPAIREEDNDISLASTNLEDGEDDFGGANATKWEDESPSPSPTSCSNGISDGERHMAMMEAMNGQFKLLVRRFLEVEGIPLISTEGDSWLDVVANISWEAAEFIKPEPSEGKEMDPWSYIKVKCVASGTPNQSVVIKGLAFKKNTAHKHMPSSFKNPKLLLLKGALAHNDSGLSSFDAVGKENDHIQESISQIVENCQPNLILVEKTVSRNIQELLVQKGISLVLDMKQNRLERISRCTGSTVVSFTDFLKDPKLNSCDSFRIERFVEEHNNALGGKKPAKTLMFLEGFPRPLGCTIILRGANSEELKKVKHVLQYAVFAAYHLIIETSFFEDQKVFLNDKLASKAEPSAVPHLPSLSDEHTQYTPKASNNGKELMLLPGFYQVNGSSNMDLYDTNVDSAIELSSEEISTDIDKEVAAYKESEKEASIGHESDNSVNKGKVDGNDLETILVLTTSQCITKQSMCEQSRYNRIKYYGNCDISLGRYLQNLLNSQEYSCSTCGEPQEAHEYSYTHRNGNLTVIVKHIDPEHHLSGDNEGKIWMWSRCLKCEAETGISMATPRVVMSQSACNLSFGKFLELSFSSQSAAGRLSKCGHLLHQDCLRFFGLGSKVAVFWYNPVEVFTAFKPPSILEYNNPYRQGWLKDEFREKVLPRGLQLFSKIENILQHLKKRLEYAKVLSEVENVFSREKSDFENLLESIEKSDKNEDTAANELLSLNWAYQDLVLQTYVWDRRLHHLLQYRPSDEEQEGTEKTEEESTNGTESLEVSGQFSLNANKAQLETTDTTQSSVVSESYLVAKEYLIENSTEDDAEKWVWSPFAELKSTYHSEISHFYLTRFFMVNKYTPVHLIPSPSNEEKNPIRFSVGPDGSLLLICEDEISSIISRALAISEIKHSNNPMIPMIEPALEKSDSLLSMNSWPLSKWSSTDSIDSPDSLSSQYSSLSSQYSLSFDEAIPLSNDLHPEVIVNGMFGLKGKYKVVCVCADEFYNLRKKCCQSEMKFIISLSRCKKWDAQGGKSKAFFAKTKDDRFIIKQIKKAELESFLEFQKEYFKYVNESIDSGNPTGLAKILGIYEVRQTKNGKETKMDLMVMENLLFGKNISRTYDLKGAIYSRHIASSDSTKDLQQVYLDQNFIDDLRVSPFYVGVKTKHLLQRAIWNDTTFLTSINVMDYSLVVGVDKERHELVFGIIDYLRQYTWDKQLETWVKSSLVVPKNSTPTVVSPKEYKKRFRKFMIKYFFTVPDSWISHHSSDECGGLCKFCSSKDSKETQLPDKKMPNEESGGSSLS